MRKDLERKDLERKDLGRREERGKRKD